MCSRVKIVSLFALAGALLVPLIPGYCLADGKFFLGWSSSSPYVPERFRQSPWVVPKFGDFRFIYPYPHYYPHSYYYNYPPPLPPASPYQPPYRQESRGLRNIEIKPAGKVVIKARPQGCLVLLDGHPLGRQEEGVPFEIGLLTGEHWVEVRKQGYRPYFEKVQLTANQRRVMEITLKAIEEKGGQK